MYLCIIIDEYQYFCKNIMCVKCRVCLKMWMIKVFFFNLTQKNVILNANFTWNKRRTYICICVYICCAFTWPKIHICIKYMYVNANIHLVWAGVYLHRVYICSCANLLLHICSCFHMPKKYTWVQIIHICIINIPCVNQRMWTGY